MGLTNHLERIVEEGQVGVLNGEYANDIVVAQWVARSVERPLEVGRQIVCRAKHVDSIHSVRGRDRDTLGCCCCQGDSVCQAW